MNYLFKTGQKLQQNGLLRSRSCRTALFSHARGRQYASADGESGERSRLFEPALPSPNRMSYSFLTPPKMSGKSGLAPGLGAASVIVVMAAKSSAMETGECMLAGRVVSGMNGEESLFEGWEGCSEGGGKPVVFCIRWDPLHTRLFDSSTRVHVGDEFYED